MTPLTGFGVCLLIATVLVAVCVAGALVTIGVSPIVTGWLARLIVRSERRREAREARAADVAQVHDLADLFDDVTVDEPRLRSTR